MNQVALRLTDYLIKNGLDSENREIFAYALECLINTVFIFGIIIIIGMILGCLTITIVWMLFFLPLRHVSGGLHARSHAGCFVMSLGIGTGCMLINQSLSLIDWIIWIGLAMNLLIIFSFAPIIHSNHPLSDIRVRSMKRVARVIICIESLLTILLYFTAGAEIAIASFLGAASATVSTLIGHLSQQNHHS